MAPVAAVFGISVIATGLALLMAHHFCKGPRLRLFLLALAILLLAGLWYLVSAPVCPGPFAFLIPYEHLGVWQTSDLDGNPCSVRVDAKAMSSTIPPGELPRIRLQSSTASGEAILVWDTGWRLGVGTVRPVKGGLEVFASLPNGWGHRFQLRRNVWSQEPIVPEGW